MAEEKRPGWGMQWTVSVSPLQKKNVPDVFY